MKRQEYSRIRAHREALHWLKERGGSAGGRQRQSVGGGLPSIKSKGRKAEFGWHHEAAFAFVPKTGNESFFLFPE